MYRPMFNAGTVLWVLLTPFCLYCGGEQSDQGSPDDPLGEQPSHVQKAEANLQYAALTAGVQEFLKAWSGRETSFLAAYKADFNKALDSVTWFRKLTRRAYEQRHFAFIFSDGHRLKDSAALMRGAVETIGSHGIDQAPYDAEALVALWQAADAGLSAYEQVLAADRDASSDALWAVLETLKVEGVADAQSIESRLREAGLHDGDLPTLDKASGYLGGMFEAKATLNKALRDVDVGLLVRFFRYGYDMRYAYEAHPFFGERDHGRRIEANEENFAALYDQTNFDQLQESLSKLVPRHPDYAALKKGLAFYRDLASQFSEHLQLPKAAKRLKRGADGEKVLLLQERLVQEGFLNPEDKDGQYGPALADAVKLYQQTHQLKETGEMDRSTLSSMNKDYSRRARDVALALQRHRESELHQGAARFGEVPVQGWVNIPAFEANFYEDGRFARRHRVIVGNNNVEVDEQTGVKGRFNRTRMFTAELKTIVLNPTWKVPRRIKEQELDLELMEEPDYYEKHNYKVRIRDDGTEEVIQLPGPNNALGLVKFLFPNRYSIYMHDTPKKRLFGKEIRAYSHGCMRTENPLDLARWILVTREGLTDDRMDSILRSAKEYGIGLKQPIPITIDYVTVGVHETGRMIFYLDVYKFDKGYWGNDTPYEMSPRHALHQAVLVD